MAEKLEDLPIYQHALKLCSAVIDLLNKPGLRRDHKLRNQISDANDSITANMEEGFAQTTDALFAKYLGYARGSLAEVIGRLRRARLKRYISDAEFADREREGDALARMLTGFMRYLAESDFKDRGTYKAKTAKKQVVPDADAE